MLTLCHCYLHRFCNSTIEWKARSKQCCDNNIKNKQFYYRMEGLNSIICYISDESDDMQFYYRMEGAHDLAHFLFGLTGGNSTIEWKVARSVHDRLSLVISGNSTIEWKGPRGYGFGHTSCPRQFYYRMEGSALTNVTFSHSLSSNSTIEWKVDAHPVQVFDYFVFAILL